MLTLNSVMGMSRMKHLCIVRHAKASDDAKTDFDRPLTKRGRRQAVALGEQVKTQDAPAVILCSPALRAKETAEILAETAGLLDKIQFVEQLYDAPTHLILTLIRRQFDPGPVMVVAHNPGLEQLVRQLLRPGHELQPLSTGMLVALEFSSKQWRDIAPGAGMLIEIFHDPCKAVDE